MVWSMIHKKKEGTFVRNPFQLVMFEVFKFLNRIKSKFTLNFIDYEEKIIDNFRKFWFRRIVDINPILVKNKI